MADFTDVAKSILKVAPLFASLLGGPIAGGAATLIAGLFGANASDPSDILSKMSADPDHDIKLKTLEDTHGEAMAQIAANSYSTEVADRANARQREIDAAKAGAQYNMTAILALILVIGFFALAAVQFIPGINIANTTISVMVGGLIREVIEVCRYYFGGSDTDSSS